MASSIIKKAVDRMGEIDAEAAELKKERARLANILRTEGGDAFEGDLFRAVIVVSEKNLLDMDAVRAKLSSQFIRANTKIVLSRSVRISARNNVGLKVAA